MSVFTIPAGVPFVDALAAGVVSKFAPEPGDLANIQILLPTRRACRALAEAFLRLGGGKPVLLPRMTPLGDVDEDELALSGLDAPLDIPLDIPLAISGLRRQLMLTRLVLAFSGGGATPDQASRLATELARLLDQIHTERLSFEGLEKLVPDKFSDHWRVTLKFLDILTKQWPKALAEEGCIDPAERRNRLLEAQTKAWLETPPSHPVIAAGSTGSIPATAGLLQTVARLPRGALVLPGLDLEMDDESWAVLEPSHPQFGMARLLKHMDVERTAVGGWPISANAKNNPERVRMLSLALKPAKTAGDSADAEIKPGGVSGMIRIDCPTPSEEAGVIALVMRETLETPGRTCALVTPDRSLARRVAVELRRWDIGIDDSAGRPLAETPTGAFLRLTAQLATEMSPITLLSVLKHPLAAGGWKSTDFRAWARRLETLLLRGPRPDSGIAGLRAALAARRKEALQRGHDKTVEALEALRPGLDILDEAFKPFMNLDAVLPGDFLRAHIAFAETLAATDAAAGAERLWGGEDGEAAALFIAELGENIDILEDPMEGRRYPALFDSLMAGRVVRPAYGRHARLHIWGNLEARLQHADVMVLGGLNEDTWPPEARPSPWMSRPMQKDFGLPSPERRIGLSAHDFVQAASATCVILTRAERVEGTPALPSRWLQRLHNLLAAAGLSKAPAPKDDWLGWAMGLDAPDGPPEPVSPPRPAPPAGARPRELPATQIETLIRDPYAIYARRILRLRPLDPLDADPDARHRGTVIHDVLDEFVRAYPDNLPGDAEEKLVSMGRKSFDQLMAWPIVRALWWPRFERIAHWFVGWERRRRESGVRTLGTEVDGFLDISLAAGSFRLKARADRIDRLPGGTLAIMDYKSGGIPTGPQMERGLAPQLPLGALIAEQGGFKDLKKAEVTDLLYIHVSGGREAGREKQPKLKEGVRNVIDKTHDGVTRMLGRYDLEETPYLSRTRVQYERFEGDYDHLARVKEWGLGGGGEEE